MRVKLRFLVLLLAAATTVGLYSQGIDQNAANAATQVRWGVLGYHRGLFNEAVLAFQKALSFDPSSSLARSWLGRAMLSSGYVPEALDAWGVLAATGRASPLLQDQIEVVRVRAGLGPELAVPPQYVASVALDGAAVGGHPFSRPTAVRAMPDGSILVVAFGSNELLRYDANFKLIENVGRSLIGFDRPYDVVAAADGTLFVSEYGANRISHLDSRGARLGTFGARLSAPPTGAAPTAARAGLLGPQYLTLDGRGYLWVTDWGNGRAVKFNLDGNYILAVDGLDGPSGIAVRDERLFIAERGAGRVSVFDLNGNPLSTLGEGILSSPEGLSFSSTGRLLVADAAGVKSIDVEQESWSVPNDLSGVARRVVLVTEDANHDLLAADFNGSRAVLLAPAASLYTGLWVRVQRVNATEYPQVVVEASVQDRSGKPVVGLTVNNFIVTENRYSVGRTQMVARPAGVDVALLVERSPALAAMDADVGTAVEQLWTLATSSGRVMAVSAGAQPAREAGYGLTRLRFRQAALQSPASVDWRLDGGVRLAGDGLITESAGARRAIVFFTSGSIGRAPWRSYAITELASCLLENEIAFYPVAFGSAPLDEQLEWLAQATGGRSFRAATPGGMADVMAAARSRVSSRYMLRFSSPSPSDFGQAYIPLEIEVTLQKASGRDEAGYYAPAR